MTDAEEHTAGTPAPIILRAAGKSVSLGGPSKWRRAIENNDLTPDTVVEIPTADGALITRRAGDIEWLRPYFQSAGLIAQQSQEEAESADRTPVSDERDTKLPRPDRTWSMEGPPSPIRPALLVAKPNDADNDGPTAVGVLSPEDPADPETFAKQADPVVTDAKRKGLSAGQIWGLIAVVLVALILVVQKCGGDPNREEIANGQQGTTVAVYARRDVMIRSGPGAAKDQLGKALRGEYLVGHWVLGADGETRWLEITAGTHEGGFAWGKNLRSEAPPRFLATTPSKRIFRGGGPVYPEPAAVGQPLDSLPPGSTVLVLATGDDGWVEIGLNAGGVGYIRDFRADQPAIEMRTPPPVVRKAVVKPVRKNVAKSPIEVPDVPKAIPPPLPPQIASPKRAPIQWARKPSGDDLARYYPSAALRAQISGRVVLSCEVTGRGAVTNCNVASESPAGYGFGDAARRLAPKFRMKASSSDGIVSGTVRIPINFSVPD